jgi:lipopolysaccharide/colanic/teichoic acid biosynthesis glycosyltransferase
MRVAYLKRFFDLSAAVLGLLFLLPLLALLALAVKLSGPGPVFFRQERVGRFGHHFRIFKFRTMRSGLARSGRLFTVEGDERITAIGSFLRRTKLDELPQLLNVLRGEMSLVGPRPEVPTYVDLFHDEYAPVLGVRPGITHRASIEFRAEENLLARVADPERYYIEQIMPRKLKLYVRDLDRESLLDDIRTILDTIAGVAFASSAGEAPPEPAEVVRRAASPLVAGAQEGASPATAVANRPVAGAGSLMN